VPRAAGSALDAPALTAADALRRPLVPSTSTTRALESHAVLTDRCRSVR